MDLYTKRGDYGNTNLIGGRTVRKDSLRVTAYGQIDELNTLIGYIVSQMDEEDKDIKSELKTLQHYLFDSGTDLADREKQLPAKITEKEVKWLESRIDEYAQIPPALKRFIIPGGHPVASLLQMARTVTRRAERHVVSLAKEEEINKPVAVFINRLSDYFFALARLVNHRKRVEEPLYDRGGDVFHDLPDKKQTKNSKQ